MLLGVGCAAGIAATTYFSYQVYNHVLKRPYRPAIQGSAGEGPTITDVSVKCYCLFIATENTLVCEKCYCSTPSFTLTCQSGRIWFISFEMLLGDNT